MKDDFLSIYDPTYNLEINNKFRIESWEVRE